MTQLIIWAAVSLLVGVLSRICRRSGPWFAIRAARSRRSEKTWKAVCVGGSLEPWAIVSLVLALCALFLDLILSQPITKEIAFPVAIGLAVAVLFDLWRYRRDAYWKEIHDSLQQGLSPDQRVASGFNATHARLTQGSLRERRGTLQRIIAGTKGG